MTRAFSQLVTLASSGMLLTALIVLWRKGVPAYISAYKWQTWLLAALMAIVGYFADDRQLYAMSVVLVLLKGVAIPRLLGTMQRRFRAEPTTTPYVNTETSLLIAGLLRPWEGEVMLDGTMASAMPMGGMQRHLQLHVVDRAMGMAVTGAHVTMRVLGRTTPMGMLQPGAHT